MNNKKKIALIIILVLLAYGYYYFTYEFNLLGECGKYDVNKAQSSNQKFELEYYILNCGATSDYATQMKLKDLTLNTEEIVVNIRGNFISNENVESVIVEWLNPNQVNITYNGQEDRIYKYQNQYKDISIHLINNGSVVMPR